MEQQRTFLGHPVGLFVLFFAEMWERFSYYGMRALLLFYMLKGFLKYGDKQAYAVYGAYTALVYMTPFFGGMLADRLLGARRAVVLGGLLMAAGHLLMGMEHQFAFFTALALLICGNGFFKPNISTMVGSLYPRGSYKRDGGFTIFYIGINLGAGISPLLCGYVGEMYDWHYGFGLATIGMLTGLAVFVMPTLITQVLVMAGALAAAFGLFWFKPDNIFSVAANVFVGVALLAAGIIAMIALNRGGLPAEAGRPSDPQRLRKPLLGFLPAEWAVYLGVLISIPIFLLLVSGFSPLTENKESYTFISAEHIKNMHASESAVVQILAVVVEEISKPAGLILLLAGLVALVYLGIQLFRLEHIPRQRMIVALILTFFSMLFWSFFEQAGTSINNFTDRNVDRVANVRVIGAEDIGTTIRLQPTQEQFGYTNGGELFTWTTLSDLRDKENNPNKDFEIDWVVAPDNVGMAVASRKDEVPASTFQALNPIFILIFGMAFTALWAFLAKRGMEPSTPVKFAAGLFQLGLGFAVLWYGAQHANERGMVLASWLVLGYLLHTTGELCLSPVGLSMITKLSPAQLVSTMMGNWFLATAFSQYLAAIIAQFTGVGHGTDGVAAVPIPKETVGIYGGVFGNIAIAAIVSAVICFILAPWLKRMMHEEQFVDPDQAAEV